MVHDVADVVIIEETKKENEVPPSQLQPVYSPRADASTVVPSVAGTPPSVSACEKVAPVPTLLEGRYLLGDQCGHAPTHRKCVDVVTGDHFLCQVTNREPDVSRLPSFVAHIRLEGHSGVNPIHKIIAGPCHTFVLYRAWDPRAHAGPNDLQALLQSRRKLPESHCRHFFRQIASLVRDAHSQGVVLRDLKLRKFVFKNLSKREVCLETLEDAVVLGMESHLEGGLVGGTGRMETSDGGAEDGERGEDDLLTDRWRCVPYCPPEILNSRKDPYSGRKADLWSLGVILYTMLVGRYPFSAAKDPTVVSRIRRGTFTIPSHVSPLAASLVRSLLQKDPKCRLSAAECLNHPWLSSYRCPSRVCSGKGEDCCWLSEDPSIFESEGSDEFLSRAVPDSTYSKSRTKEETTKKVDPVPDTSSVQEIPDIY